MPQDNNSADHASASKISAQDVQHLAQLARLRLSEEDVERFSRQLSSIVDYMDVLNTIDTSGVKPLYSPVQHKIQYREDVAVHVRTREQILANAPERDENYFIVPRIV